MDLDPFDDVPLEPAMTIARAGGKFQPKAKTKPRNIATASVPVLPQSEATENADALLPNSTNMSVSLQPDVADTSLDAGNDSPARKECRDSMDALHVETVTSDGDYGHSYSKVTQEVESLEIDLDHLGGVPLKTYTTRRFGKFQHKVNPLIRKEITAPVSSCLVTCANKETATRTSIDPGKALSVQSLDVVDGTCPVLETDTLPLVSNDNNGLQENLAVQNNGSSSTLMEFDVASKHPVSCSIHTNNGMLETEFQESRAFSNFQPTVMFPEIIVASETTCINESSTPAFSSDDVLDYSTINFDDFTASELPTNEGHANIAPTSCPQDANLEDTGEEPEDENRESKASSALNQINKGHASSRQLRKRAVASRLVVETEDGVGDLAVEPPCSSALDKEDKDYEYGENEDDNDNDNSGQKYSSQKDKMSKRSKKHTPEKEKPVRKRKGSDDAPDLSSQKAPRKFSHSTRRKKRLRELLALPEHEIEFQRLPCRDVILLAEHREQLASKEAKAAKTSQNNQSTEKSLDGNNEDDTQGNSRTEPIFTLFNSHSFMDKTPRIKWSKQDTELFYEVCMIMCVHFICHLNLGITKRSGCMKSTRTNFWHQGVQQFGTDLSMIQQLFPGRTRHQIKLKLKKEERQQPTRLYEALSNRSKDHSYFEKVIEQLQKVAAQAEEEFDKDESVGGTGKEEADLYSENNDVAGKSENDNDAAGDDGVNTAQVHSPVKSDENDDDLDIWSSYTC